MKPATLGQFHHLIARFLTGINHEKVNFDGIQILVENPDFADSQFIKFLSNGGMHNLPVSRFPIWKIILIGIYRVNRTLRNMVNKNSLDQETCEKIFARMRRGVREVYLVCQEVKDFGFIIPPTREAFYFCIREQGYELCPQETAFYVWEKLIDQKEERIFIASNHIDMGLGREGVFTLDKTNNGSNIGIQCLSNDSKLDLNQKWIVQVPVKK